MVTLHRKDNISGLHVSLSLELGVFKLILKALIIREKIDWSSMGMMYDVLVPSPHPYVFNDLYFGNDVYWQVWVNGIQKNPYSILIIRSRGEESCWWLCAYFSWCARDNNFNFPGAPPKSSSKIHAPCNMLCTYRKSSGKCSQKL